MAGVESAPANGRTLRLLVAEDNLVNQEIARHTLRKAGHAVDLDGTGHEAVNAVKSGVYDAILMDIHMPEMDGLTATRLIRDLGGANADVPITALTADAMSGNREQFLSAGMSGFVSKPFDPPRLHATIARCVWGGDGSGPAPAEPVDQTSPDAVPDAALDPAIADPLKNGQPDL